MITQQERRRLVLKTGNWVGAITGSGVGLFFILNVIFKNVHPGYATPSRLVFLVLLTLGGAVLGWFAIKPMARQVIAGKPNFFLTTFKGILFGMLFCGLMVGFLGGIFNLFNAPNYPNLDRGIVGNFGTGFFIFGIYGVLLGAIVGFLFGIFAGLVIKRERASPSGETVERNSLIGSDRTNT